MNSTVSHQNRCCDLGPFQESRSVRFNLPVQSPSRWRLLRELLFDTPNRIFRYRHLSSRMLGSVIRRLNRKDCQ